MGSVVNVASALTIGTAGRRAQRRRSQAAAWIEIVDPTPAGCAYFSGSTVPD